jgi:hypothetical protein
MTIRQRLRDWLGINALGRPYDYHDRIINMLHRTIDEQGRRLAALEAAANESNSVVTMNAQMEPRNETA